MNKSKEFFNNLNIVAIIFFIFQNNVAKKSKLTMDNDGSQGNEKNMDGQSATQWFPTIPDYPPWASLCHNARGHQKPQWIDDIRGQYTTSCYDAQVAQGPIHPPVHDYVRSDLSSSCYDVQVSPGHFNSLRQQ